MGKGCVALASSVRASMYGCGCGVDACSSYGLLHVITLGVTKGLAHHLIRYEAFLPFKNT